MPPSPKPTILLLQLDQNSSFEPLYGSFITKLQSLATLNKARQKSQVLQSLASNDEKPGAILVTDPEIVQHKNLITKLMEYVRSGGTLVLMGNFSTFIRPSDQNALFRTMGLPWKREEYLRTTVYLNASAANSIPSSQKTKLPPNYSQKAVFLTGVERNDAWYLPTAESRTESLVFAGAALGNLEMTPVACKRVGEGKVGYVGDVNGEEGSDAVVLAMCGLA